MAFARTEVAHVRNLAMKCPQPDPTPSASTSITPCHLPLNFSKAFLHNLRWCENEMALKSDDARKRVEHVG
ncbi:hypothetical protein SCHPADRAFT_704039 [Schizopora paradoxa]|uniref:Uncharacterized protein n=1 Tax=Schizopora paradoxa TaxID=27342 RepID=A0A0H2R2J1_9AGAM|nr:hypothetical protein SCHPADRAFT_704039 [Schizopora paradoxa]